LALRSPTSGASYGPLLGSRHLAIRIQQQLEDLLASSMEETVANNRHAGLLLWMAAMGAWAATQNAPSANEGEEDQPGEQILLQRTTLWQELVRALGINTLDAFRAHMLSFLWVEQSCSYFLSSMWESMNGSVYEIVDDYQAKSVHV
jgi:hypothetical protein